PAAGPRTPGPPKRGVSPRLHDFRLEHAPPGWRPGPGGIDALGIEAATGRRPLAMGLRQGAPLMMETSCLLDKGSGLAEQDGIAREAQNNIRPAVGGDHSDDLRGGDMTVPADQDVGAWPMVP